MPTELAANFAYTRHIFGFAACLTGLLWALSFAPLNVQGSAFRVLHSLALSLNVGVALWTNFVVGLDLFRNLPRIWFTKMQNVMLPKFFLLEIATTMTLLAARHKMGYQVNVYVEAGLLLFALACFSLNPRFISPILALQKKRFQIEREAGLSTPDAIWAEADFSSLGDNKEYQKVNKCFRKQHGMSTLCNLVGFVAMLSYLVIAACNS